MQERTCADCGVDISARHGNAKRCVGCSRRVSAEIQRNRPPREVRRRGVELDERVCTACRATFMPRRESQQTCSNRCYMWTQRHPTDERRTSQTCAGCANVFIPTHQAQFYCSPRCSAAASKRRTRKNVRPYIRYATCVTCGADLPADQKAGTKYCSATCGRRDRRGEAERMAALTERSCAYCGTVFMPRNWRGVTCSRRCSSMWHYIQNKDLYSRRAMAYMETHRARYREMAREWRRANIEQRRALERAYYAANRERFAVHLQKRRASKRWATGTAWESHCATG